MLKSLPYKTISILLIFALALIIPLAATVALDVSDIFSAMDDASPMNTAQKIAYGNQKEILFDDMIIVSMYVFVFALIVVLYIARKALKPFKMMHDSMRLMADGAGNIRLDYASTDEIGEAARSFNEISRKLDTMRKALWRQTLISERSSLPLVEMDDDLTIRAVNAAFPRAFGYIQDELVGYRLVEFFSGDSAKQFRRRLVEGESGEVMALRANVLTKEDGPAPVSVDVIRIVDEEGTSGGLAAYMRDLRSVSILEEALKLERENSEAIMDSTEDMVLIVDRDFSVVSANLAMRVKYGRDIKGEPCHEAMYGRKERCFMAGETCTAREVFETGKPFRHVIEKEDPEGPTVFLDVLAYPLMDSAGEPNHVVMSMRDVTERVSFEDEVDRKNKELAALNEISGLLSRSLRTEGVYPQVIDRVCELFTMDGGGIFLLDDMGRNLRCDYSKGLSQEFQKSIRTLGVGQDIPGKVVSSGSALVIQDVTKDPLAEDSAFRHTGIRSFACVPVRGKEKLIGVFFVFGLVAHHFRDGDEGIMESISEMMGISVENTRLYERMKAIYEQDRQRRSEERKGLLELSSTIASSSDLDAVLGSVMEHVRRLCWADFAWLALGEGKGGFVLRACTDKSFEPGAEIYAPGTQSLEGQCIERREPLVVPAMGALRNITLEDRLAGYVAATCIPLYVGDRSLGALSLYYMTEVNPSEDEVHFLQTVGSVIGVALERSRLFESAAIQRGMAETVLESIGDGVLAVDPEGVVISMNGAACDIFGFRHGQAVGLSASEAILRGNDNFEFASMFNEALEKSVNGEPAAFDSAFVRKDGSRVPVAFAGSPASTSGGGLVGVVFVVRDLRTRLEIDKMKTDFVRRVSHEFRTPLTAIVGMTEMVLEGDLEPERSSEYLETVLSESRRLAGMISDVLDIARIESGRAELIKTELDFDKILDTVRLRTESQASEHEAKVEMSVESAIKAVGDAEKLRQMIGHLVQNSLTYSDKGVNISVSVRGIAQEISITVKDDGWGIEPDDIGSVGERFFRGTTPHTRKGTGLGVAISRQIAHMHGGVVEIESEIGKGTSVKVRMPIGRV